MRLRIASAGAALLLALAATACTSSPTSPSFDAATTTARYRVTFQSTWSASSHPVEFPSTAHFSSLVGGTHDARATFWREGLFATDGIKDMAERGLTSTLSGEINAAIGARTAEHVFTGGNIGESPGSATAEFEISQGYPLVTLVSMIAPSPDWFVGVSAVPLYSSGRWTTSQTFSLDAWDAGTDGGATFLSPDLAVNPRLPVSRILTAPLSPGGRTTPLGTFTFTRVQ